jgi:tripartite-type tricarboxylate transporter receptor subunit TctC
MTPARENDPDGLIAQSAASPSRRCVIAAAGAAAVTAWMPGRARADRYPSRTVRIIAPQAPGGPSDTIARLVAQHFSERWTEAAVVENHGGAAGTVAGRLVARSPADGYTLLIGSNAPIASAAVLTEGAGYDPLRDWAPVGRIVRVGYVLALRPGLGVTTLRGLVALAGGRAEPLTMATVGTGSNSARAVAQFARVAGIPLIDVAYKGGAPGLQAVIGEHVDGTFCDVALALPFAATGAVRIPASCGRRRLPLLPDTPTFAEAGFPGVIAEPWYGIVAPAGTSAAILAEIATALRAMQADPEIGRRFTALGYEAIVEAPEEFAAAIRAEVAQAREAVGGGAPRR